MIKDLLPRRRISLVDDKKLDVVLPIKNMERVVGLDWHANHAGGLLFWSDINADRIYRSDWDGRNQKVSLNKSTARDPLFLR